MTQANPERPVAAGIFSGLLLVTAGMLLLAGNFNLFPLRPTFMRLWPILLMAMGVKHLIAYRGSRGVLGASFWIGSGMLFLSSTLGYLNIGISRLIWPVMFIWFGVILFLGQDGSGKQSDHRSDS